MVSAMTEERPDQAPVRKSRPGSGVLIDPAKLTWMRNNRKLTRKQLSDKIREVSLEQGITDDHEVPVTYSQDAVAKLENGERKPKMYTFEALCAALDCEPADLQEDFPGSARLPLPAGMPRPDEVARVLGDSDEPVDTLYGSLSTRACTSIRLRSGCTTVGELARANTDGSLEETRKLGFVQLNEIRRVLATLAADRIAADENDLDRGNGGDVAKAG